MTQQNATKVFSISWKKSLTEGLLCSILTNSPTHQSYKSAFTLVEISIVIVIIGFIIGGILVGQDLTESAKIRSQISQIEQYQTAVNTFKAKYGYLPGDMPNAEASSFGLTSRSYTDGNNNGVIDNWVNVFTGEVSLFWNDLANAGLIGGNFIYIGGGYGTTGYNLAPQTGAEIAKYIPPAKLGSGNYIYIWNGGVDPQIWMGGGNNGVNYFGLAQVQNVVGYSLGGVGGTNSYIKVRDAYDIDKKIDDGLPQTGDVIAAYWSYSSYRKSWAKKDGIGAGNSYGTNHIPITNLATPYSLDNCYDNNGVAGIELYSISKNSDSLNCALSFKFK